MTDVAACADPATAALLVTCLSRLTGSVGQGLAERLAPVAELREARAGETVLQEGDPAGSMYLVLRGRLRAFAGSGEERRVLGDIPPGEVVGEQSLLTGAARSATVVAVRTSLLAHLPAADVVTALEGDAELALGLARLVVQRSQSTGGRPSELHRSLAVVDLSGDPLSRTFARRLTGALSRFGPTQLINAQTHPAVAAEKLQALEDSCRFVVYDLSGAGEAWRRAALDRVDEVLFAAAAAWAGTEVRPIENEVATRCAGEAPPHRRLVLLHEASESPAMGGTRAWLVDRDVDDVHHARVDDPDIVGRPERRSPGGPGPRQHDDISSLARILAGRAVSVVFGGGAARGFAHLGVLRALEDLNVPVDQLGGSSIGAVIAAGPAMGRDSAASTEDCRQRFRRIIDRTLPVVSFARGKRLMRAIGVQYGNWDIEDLWRPYFCVSTSLTRNRTVVHRRGPLGLAIRASVAIPAVFPPLPHEGELLVDGSLLDNLPIDEMRRLNPTGTIIAVDVAPARGRPSRASYGAAVSGWRALGDRLRRRGGRTPGLATTVLRSMMVASSRDRDRVVARGVADLYLDLDIRNVGPFDFHAVDIGAEAGYELALPRLVAWLETAGRPWEPTPTCASSYRT